MSVRPVSLIVSGATLAAFAPLLLTERILPALEAIETVKTVRCLEATTHRAAMENILGHNSVVDFLGGYRFHHLQVIVLIDLLQLL